MKSLKMKYLTRLDHSTAAEAADLMKAELMTDELDWNTIDSLNWPQSFPAKPACRFRIARSKTKLFILFEVSENFPKALYLNDQDPVWKDSCVEFFCKLPGAGYYYNFEFNCIGTCLASRRKARKVDVVPLSDEEMLSIERHSSLDSTAFEGLNELTHWNLTVSIPLDLLQVTDASEFLGNFYKCGDETVQPHYLSWNPIDTPKPDFHRPEFFGTLKF